MSIDEVRRRVDARIAAANEDPEMGHGDIDGLLEEVIRDIAAGHPDGTRMAIYCVELLDYEEKAGWMRWYA